MSKQYAFFYLMKNDPEKIRDIIPEHIRYWKDNKPINYSGGPFGDRSGGLILFGAKDMETAADLAMNDPFVVQKVIENKWLKEWIREE
jgi:uncharacterized protein YciI